jgi:DNA-binding transcriptional LysR family regulator
MIDNLLRFKKVVEAGSINKASRLLYVSQPALSKSIKMLEQQFGVAILERTYTGTKPTEFGQIVYRSACEIELNYLRMTDQILALKRAADRSAGNRDISVGCSTIWNDFLLPSAMRSLDLLSTQTINVTIDISEQLFSDLAERNAYDFVLCRIIENHPYRNLESIPLFKTQAAIFTNRHHPIFSTKLEKDELQKLKWIKIKSMPVLPRSELTPTGSSLFPDNFFPPKIAYEVEDLMAAVQLVMDDYVMLLPLAIEKLMRQYDIVPLPFPKSLTRSYWQGIVYPKEQEIPTNIAEIINKIRILYTGESIIGS